MLLPNQSDASPQRKHFLRIPMLSLTGFPSLQNHMLNEGNLALVSPKLPSLPVLGLKRWLNVPSMHRRSIASDITAVSAGEGWPYTCLHAGESEVRG